MPQFTNGLRTGSILSNATSPRAGKNGLWERDNLVTDPRRIIPGDSVAALNIREPQMKSSEVRIAESRGDGNESDERVRGILQRKARAE